MSTASASVTGLTGPSLSVRSQRVESIDLLRGIVIIIMALDHARDYFARSAYLFDPTDLHQTTVALFFTRWITHFCAPIFMLLAGIAAYLYGIKNGRKALSFFLLTRGIWLILAEMFIVTLGWTFNTHFTIYILQVIWAFGISMVVLSGLVYVGGGRGGGMGVVGRMGGGRRIGWMLAIAVILIAGHDLLDGVHVGGNGGAAFAWAFLHEQRPFCLVILWSLWATLSFPGSG
jgi:uncharacterized membrane protein